MLDECEESFQNLNKLLLVVLNLLLTFEGKDFIVFSNPSLLGLGVVLM